MSIDLSTLSAKELGSLITTARKRQAKLAKRVPAAALRTKLIKLAKAGGYTIEELFEGVSAPAGRGRAAKGAAKPGRKLGKVAPKYRNPENPKETWTGRGKQPRWLAALTAKGRSLGDFVIPGAAKPATKTPTKSATRKRVVKKAAK